MTPTKKYIRSCSRETGDVTPYPFGTGITDYLCGPYNM